MTENKGWDEDRLYTVIRNKTKNSKVVLSTLNGVEVGPGQTVDLRTMFRRAQVQDATHEIASLIKTGHLEDIGEGAAKGPDAARVAGGMPTAEEMAAKKREASIREISDSSSLSALEDWMKSADKVVADAARIRAETLLGIRDDNGQVIPGAGEDLSEGEPTKLIRSPSTDPSVEAAEPVGAVRRSA